MTAADKLKNALVAYFQSHLDAVATTLAATENEVQQSRSGEDVEEPVMLTRETAQLENKIRAFEAQIPIIKKSGALTWCRRFVDGNLPGNPAGEQTSILLPKGIGQQIWRQFGTDIIQVINNGRAADAVTNMIHRIDALHAKSAEKLARGDCPLSKIVYKQTQDCVPELIEVRHQVLAASHGLPQQFQRLNVMQHFLGRAAASIDKGVEQLALLPNNLIETELLKGCSAEIRGLLDNIAV
ncbi:hypothetical protein [Ferrimonas marina]|uniref:Uncharacterized protein n=1 Tax=Ferrimonas marina TaxID=299255 RepID=A0A1M5TNY5_9GAMM|nr:hypothetical protein [Ferrimonas marina]SHH52381.1 hypothetical protein SAMN02745129_2219 [Ferrimonas marina]